MQRAGGAAVYRVGSQLVCRGNFDSAPGIRRVWPDEGIALSQHRTGARSSRRKRGLFRRFGIVFPAAVIAAIAVIGVAVGASVFAPGSGAFSAAEAIEAGPGSHTMTLLEAEREQLIAMTAAARTLTVVAKPKLASPAQVAAANPGTGTGSGTGSGRNALFVSTSRREGQLFTHWNRPRIVRR